MKESKILVSACLLGENCKYSGGNNRREEVIRFLEGRQVIPVCPERVLGVPRTPMEIVDGVLTDKNGRNVDAPVRRAVAEILESLAGENIEMAILKSRSPTCGVKQIYDGTFTGTRIDGMGALARALQARGIPLMDAEDVPEQGD